jgi:DNA-3-methyladenine glycosylase II
MSRKDFSAQLGLAEKHLAKTSPLLRRLIRAHGPCSLVPAWKRSPFEALTQAVIHQQLNGIAAGKILQRFIGLFPDTVFPSPEQVLAASEDELRSAGLSRQKATYIQDIARQTQQGIVPLKQSTLSRIGNDEIIVRLTQVKGVGPWTAEMMLIFTLGRLDVLPVDDFGVRKGFSIADGRAVPVTPHELRELGAAWAPYRTVASWYFWRVADQA